MSDTIRIDKSDFNKNQIVYTGDNFERLIHELPAMTGKEVDNIRNSTIRILSHCVPPSFEYYNADTNTGLVIGYIQSGKTMSFTSLIALASDNKYKLVIVFAGTTNLLLNQTIERLMEDLDDRNSYVIITEGDLDKANRIKDIIQNKERERIIILPILKHYKHVERLESLFKHAILKKYLNTKSVLIIDDEADQASLNGLARRNWKRENSNLVINENEKEFSTTYDRIVKLKDALPNHTYIQYTATPQANILLGHRDLLRPSWCEVLDPGIKYTGGMRFFNDSLDLIEDIDVEKFDNNDDPDMPNTLKNAFRLFLIESALLCYDYDSVIRNREKRKITSMMIHADRLIDVNSSYIKWLKSFKNNIKLDLTNDEYEELQELKITYDHVKVKLREYFKEFPDFEAVIKKIQYWVLDDLEFWFVAGDGDDEVKWKSGVHHVLVGGQKLDRGFTVKELIVTYMPRSSKGISNADTIEQRCRYFGYKKDYIEACRVFLPQQSTREFIEYVSFEKDLRRFLKDNPIDEFYNNDRLMKISGLNPTSLNKIPGELLRYDFWGYKYFEPDYNNQNHNNSKIIEFLKSIKFLDELKYEPSPTEDNRHKVFKTDIKKIRELLDDLKFDRYREKIKRDQMHSILEDVKAHEKVWVIEMSYLRENGRPRSLSIDGNLKSLASNHPPSFGDRVLLKKKSASGKFKGQYNNELIIQIHKVKILETDGYPQHLKRFENKIFYTIAISFPNKLSNSYLSVSYV